MAYRIGLLSAMAAVAVLPLLTSATRAEMPPAPHRVVSLNVCTDQLAMLIASPDQIHSLSHLATDPNSSALAAAAHRYVINHGHAEDIFLMRPDLVLAGTYTDTTTVRLLRRLGIHVEQFPPASSLKAVETAIRRMGKLLHRQAKADTLLKGMEAKLASLRSNRVPARSVAVYYANSYTSGTGTLVDAAITAAGLTNVADGLGLKGAAKLPLESLIVADPDIIVTSKADYGGPSLATQDYANPAFKALLAEKATLAIPSSYTLCGTPFVLRAIRMLQHAAKAGAAE